jgi:hypothetical protein
MEQNQRKSINLGLENNKKVKNNVNQNQNYDFKRKIINLVINNLKGLHRILL